MKTLAELADEIWAWQQTTFGDAMTVQGAVNKLRDECDEVVREYRNLLAWRDSRRRLPEMLREARVRVREELADCFFMLVQLDGLTSDDGGCLLFQFEEAREVEPFEVCMGRLKAHALWADQWNGLIFAKAAWMDACTVLDAAAEMPAAIQAKLAKNKARTWAKPAADWTISHVKEVL